MLRPGDAVRLGGKADLEPAWSGWSAGASSEPGPQGPPGSDGGSGYELAYEEVHYDPVADPTSN
jgi:hypothetical protein